MSTWAEAVDDLLREHARQLEVLAEEGCGICGEPATAIVWPTGQWLMKRRTHPSGANTIEITEEVALLCETHEREQGPVRVQRRG